MSPDGQADRSASRTGRRHGAAVILLLVLGTVFTPAALVGHWARTTVFDTTGYVNAVAPLVGQAQVQDSVVDTLTTALIEETDLRLPRTAVVEPLIRTSAREVVASSAFADVWRATNRVSHQQIRLFLTDKSRFLRSTNGTVSIPVADLLAPVRAAVLRNLPSGVRNLCDRIPAPTTHAQLVLIDSPALSRAQTLAAGVNAAGLVLPLAAALSLLMAILLSQRRRSTTVVAGLAVAGAAALVVGAVILARLLVVSRAAVGRRDLLGAVYGALTGPLLLVSVLVCVSGTLLALAAAFGRGRHRWQRRRSDDVDVVTGSPVSRPVLSPRGCAAGRRGPRRRRFDVRLDQQQ